MSCSYECERMMCHRCRWHGDLAVASPCDCHCHATAVADAEKLQILEQRAIDLGKKLVDRETRLDAAVAMTRQLQHELNQARAKSRDAVAVG